MRMCRPLLGAVSLFSFFSQTGLAPAQSFDERWSLVPFEERWSPISKPVTPLQVPRTIESTPQSNWVQPVTLAGKASYISYKGGKTASGAMYQPQALTAAHRTLSFGTRLMVTDLESGKRVEVTVNDRGPFIKERILDLSRGAAQVLGMIKRGVVQVRAEVLPSANVAYRLGQIAE